MQPRAVAPPGAAPAGLRLAVIRLILRATAEVPDLVAAAVAAARVWSEQMVLVMPAALVAAPEAATAPREAPGCSYSHTSK